MKLPNSKNKGFTLIEMLVAIFVFSIIMTIATGAIFSIVSANKTSQALKSVMDNLNSALDSMSRNIRYGTHYYCGKDGDFSTTKSCSDDGKDTFSFVDRTGLHVIYTFEVDPDALDGSGSLYRCVDSLDNCTRLTAPEVHITNAHFYVQGAESWEAGQPQLLITLTGYAQAGVNQSTFDIETSISQRNLTLCKDSLPAALRDCN